MGFFRHTVNFTKDQFAQAYSGISKEQLASAVDDLFKRNGYRPVGEMNGVTSYEKGDRTTRILLGAFSKYFKFGVSYHQDNDSNIVVNIGRATSGMSGGLIGMNQVANEMKNLATALQTI